MSFESPMNFVPQEKKPMSPEAVAAQEYQPVSSSGLENLAAEEEIEYIPVSEEEGAPDTMREESAPYTTLSEHMVQELVSGVREISHETASADSDQMKPVSSENGAPVAYEITVPGTIKTAGDRNLPPYTASSLDPDQEAGDGREAA